MKTTKIYKNCKVEIEKITFENGDYYFEWKAFKPDGAPIELTEDEAADDGTANSEADALVLAKEYIDEFINYKS